MCDAAQAGRIGITDFEIGLMVNDFLPNYGLTLVDVFHMFDLEGQQIQNNKKKSKVSLMCLVLPFGDFGMDSE